jgi:hypothetical protein
VSDVACRYDRLRQRTSIAHLNTKIPTISHTNHKTMRSTLMMLALAALSTSTVIERGSTAGGLSNVIADATELAADLNKLVTAIDVSGCNTCAYTNNQLLLMLVQAGECEIDAGNVTQSLGNSASFNNADSQQLGNVFMSTLQPAMTSMVNDLVAHSKAFSTNTAVAATILSEASVSAMSIVSAVVTKVTGPTATADASSYSSVLHSALNSAKAVYPL